MRNQKNKGREEGEVKSLSYSVPIKGGWEYDFTGGMMNALVKGHITI